MKKYLRALLIVPAAAALAVVLYFHSAPVESSPSTDAQECVITDEGAATDPTAVQCGRCGDGHCTPQCGETALNCPADCSGSSS